MTLDLVSRDRAYIIAEAGTCHVHPDPVWRYRRACEYVAAARLTGADAVKFQMFAAPIRDDMFCWIEGDEARSERWSASALSIEDWKLVEFNCRAVGIDFLASVFQYRTVAWLKELGVKATKVASRAAATFPYQDATGTVLVSNGMCELDWSRSITPDHVWLQCEANYPSTAHWDGRLPGFSDHSGTPERAIDAISRGCKLVEVHFYIDPAHAGPDLPASLDLAGLRKVCAARDQFANQRSAA